MATFLRSQAVATLDPSQGNYYRSVYGDNETNPIYQGLAKELGAFLETVRLEKHGTSQKLNNMLFEIWNKYETKVTRDHFDKKMLEIGDKLLQAGEYNLAVWQCYDRYLKKFAAEDGTAELQVEDFENADSLKATYFPSGFTDETATLTFRALTGKALATCQLIIASDRLLRKEDSLQKCVRLLNLLRLLMQSVLPIDALCWLVYNGTVYIYTICRQLMSSRQSAKALPYLLWSAVCMEQSLPLMLSKHLSWRTTLYTAVCQCYFDSKMPKQAEDFARRGLTKINELSQLELASNAANHPLSILAFREATIRMAVMIFKSVAIESRRRPKGQLRPRVRTNYNNYLNLAWPRTLTEKLLAEMFEGSSAQFLCLLETLHDSNRRVFQNGLAASESDPEILDVYVELFLAAKELIAGGGGSCSTPAAKLKLTEVANVGGVIPIESESLLDLAKQAQNGIPLRSVCKLLQYAHCFEHWDVFDQLLPSVVTLARTQLPAPQPQPQWLNNQLKLFELLAALQRMVTTARKRKAQAVKEFLKQPGEKEKDARREREKEKEREKEREKRAEEKEKEDGEDAVDELQQFADVLYSITQDPLINTKHGVTFDIDAVNDAVGFLWKKCKRVFQKCQLELVESPKRYLERTDQIAKWINVLMIVYKTCTWLNEVARGTVDPLTYCEVVLRLSSILERYAVSADDVRAQPSTRTATATTATGASTRSGISDLTYGGGGALAAADVRVLRLTASEQLQYACSILKDGLFTVQELRKLSLTYGPSSVADITWDQKLNTEAFQLELPSSSSVPAQPETLLQVQTFLLKPAERAPTMPNDSPVADDQTSPSSRVDIWTVVNDLQIEIVNSYFRVLVRLQIIELRNSISNQSSKKTLATRGERANSNFEQLALRECKGNGLLTVLLNLHYSTLYSRNQDEQERLVNEAYELLLKHENSEIKLYANSTSEKENGAGGSVPPPPVLLCRTQDTVILRPAKWNQAGIAYYKVFAQQLDIKNKIHPKVRLSDNQYAGCGIAVPVTRCEFTVSKLEPDRKYMFAVAAYTRDGKMVGDAIGLSTMPVLASYPPCLLLYWTYLMNTAYELGFYEVALRVFDKLWQHFVLPQAPEPNSHVTRVTDQEFRSIQYKLNPKILSASSPVLLRQFMLCVFMRAEIGIRQQKLECDTLYVQSVPTASQQRRVRLCEQLLVVIDAAGWVNDCSLALQTVVMCYGLLAPVMYYKLISRPVVNVLQKCMAVLAELPPSVRKRVRSRVTQDGLHHLIACVTYYMSMSLKAFRENELLALLNEVGKTMLAHEMFTEVGHSTGPALPPTAGSAKDGADKQTMGESTMLSEQRFQQNLQRATEDGGADSDRETGTSTIGELIRKRRTAQQQPGSSQQTASAPNLPKSGPQLAAQMLVPRVRPFGREENSQVNEELKALESYMMSISKQMVSTYMFQEAYFVHGLGDHNLTGNEDPSILHAYITFLPSKIAFKEVMKFKKKPQFLEFFVRVLQKAVSESAFEQSIEWCHEMQDWVDKRNEAIIGPRVIPKRKMNAFGSFAEMTQDEQHKWFAALVAEYAGEKLKGRAFSSKKKKKEQPRERVRRKPGRINEDPVLQLGEEHTAAMETLSSLLPRLIKQHIRRKRFRKVLGEELPWRIHLNFLQALICIGTFTHKLETRHSALSKGVGVNIYKVTQLDPEMFSLETCGKLVNWPEFHQPSHAASAPAHDDAAGATATVTSPSRKKKESVPPQTRVETPVETVPLKELSELLQAMFANFQRSLVLAHRGNNWTQLQNVVKTLYNSYVTVSMHVSAASNALVSTSLQAQPAGAEQPGAIERLGQHVLNSYAWEPFFTAADTLMDVLIIYCRRRERDVMMSDLDFDCNAFPFLYGTSASERGGSSLNFEPLLDETAAVDLRFIKLVCIKALELCVAAERYERLVHLALTFSAVSGNRYADVVLPLMGHAQVRLIERLRQSGGVEPPQPHYTRTLKTHNVHAVTERMYTQLQLVVGVLSTGRKRVNLDPASYLPGAQSQAVTKSNLGTSLVPAVGSVKTVAIATEHTGSFTARSQRDTSRQSVSEVGSRQNGSKADAYRTNTVATNRQSGAKTEATDKLQSIAEAETVSVNVVIENLKRWAAEEQTMARRNISVPLDLQYTQLALSQALEIAQYSSRALRYARTLLVTYLAGRSLLAQLDPGADKERASLQKQLDESLHNNRWMAVDQRSEIVSFPFDFAHQQHDFDAGYVHASLLGVRHFDLVVCAYEKAVELLLVKKHLDLAAQAMHELGSLFASRRNLKRAFRCWSLCLQYALKTNTNVNANANATLESKLESGVDVLEAVVGRQDHAQLHDVLVQKCGVWGCILSGIVAAKISQFVAACDIRQRSDYAILAATYFRAVFSHTMPHPRNDFTYAIYDIGRGTDVQELLPGLALCDDRFRCDARALVGALRWTVKDLIRANHYVLSFPLIAFYEHVAVHVCRDLHHTVLARLSRLESLVHMRMFREGFALLKTLWMGERLPQAADSEYKKIDKLETLEFEQLQFSSCERLLSSGANFRVLDLLISRRLTSQMRTVYGPFLTCEINLAQAQFLIELADTIPGVPITPETHNTGINQPPTATTGFAPSALDQASTSASGAPATSRSTEQPLPMSSASGPSSSRVSPAPSIGAHAPDGEGGPPSSRAAAPPLAAPGIISFVENPPIQQVARSKKRSAMDSDTSQSIMTVVVKNFADQSRPISDEVVKGLLLHAAEILANLVNNVVEENADRDAQTGEVRHLGAFELELLCKLRLAQSSIHLQRHETRLAVRLLASLMRLLQRSDKLLEKIVQEASAKPKENEGSFVAERRNSRKFNRIRLRAEAQAASNEVKKPHGAPSAPTPPSLSGAANELFGMDSRQRLDARLWLQCRRQLIKAMLCEVPSGVEFPLQHEVLDDLADSKQQCQQALEEASLCRDEQAQATFLLQEVVGRLQDGSALSSLGTLVSKLDVIETLYRRCTLLSDEARLYWRFVSLLRADLQLNSAREERADSQQFASACQTRLDAYCATYLQLLADMERVGFAVRRVRDKPAYYSVLESLNKIILFYAEDSPDAGMQTQPVEQLGSLQNVYSPYNTLLQQVLHRIGLTLGRLALCTRKPNDFVTAHIVLQQTLAVSRIISMRNAQIEAQVLLDCGKVQRQLFDLGILPPQRVARTLLDAIRLTYVAEHDCGLMHQAYLELALLLFVLVGHYQVEPGSGQLMPVLEKIASSVQSFASMLTPVTSSQPFSVGLSVSTGTKAGASPQQVAASQSQLDSQKGGRRAKPRVRTADMEQQALNDRLLQTLAICIRYATSAGRSQRQLWIMPTQIARQSGMLQPVQTTQSPAAGTSKDRNKQHPPPEQHTPRSDRDLYSHLESPLVPTAPPDFFLFDTLGSYVIGEKRLTALRDEVENELRSMLVGRSNGPTLRDDHSEQVQRMRLVAPQIVTWPAVLAYHRALQRTANLHSWLASADPLSVPSQANVRSFSLHNAVRGSLLASATVSCRLTHLHAYMSTFCTPYNALYYIAYPPDNLNESQFTNMLPSTMLAGPATTNLSEGQTAYTAGYSTVDFRLVMLGAAASADRVPGTLLDVYRPPDKALVKPVDNEVNFVWYEPTFEHSVLDGYVLLFFTCSRKVDKTNTVHCSGIKWISKLTLRSVHDRLSALYQRVEAHLTDKKRNKLEEAGRTTVSPLGRSGSPGRQRADATSSPMNITVGTAPSQLSDKSAQSGTSSVTTGQAQATAAILSDLLSQLEDNLRECVERIQSMFSAGTRLGWSQFVTATTGTTATTATATATATATTINIGLSPTTNSTRTGASQLLSESSVLSSTESEAPPPVRLEGPLPFEMTRENLFDLSQLFDDQYGHTVRGSSDLVNWLQAKLIAMPDRVFGMP